jgi:molecular chaperone GrpE
VWLGFHAQAIYAQREQLAMSDTTTENKDIEAEAGAPEEEMAPASSDDDASKDQEEASSADEGDAEKGDGETATEGDGEEPAPPPEPTPEERLAAAKDETKAMKEKMLRVAADFENYRRRAQKETDEARQRGKQGAVKDLLPVFDNLERATAHVDDKTDVNSMLDGLHMVHKQFIDVLGKMGIERIDALGKGFDPTVHESIQYEHSDEYEAGIVMNELQPGYRQGNMLLRPALVMVSRGPAPDDEASSDAEKTEADAEEADETDDRAADGESTDETVEEAEADDDDSEAAG